MLYAIDFGIRLLATLGLVVMIIGVISGWGSGDLVGKWVWLSLVPWCFYVSARLFVKQVSELIRDLKYHSTDRMPVMVVILADKFNVAAPRKMKVTSRSDFSAGVSGKTLIVSSGFRPLLWSTPGEGVLAHEMAHLARNHQVKSFATVWFVFALAYFPLVLGAYTWPTAVAVFVTVFSVVIPALFRYQEYQADSDAAEAIGTNQISSALRILKHESKWHVDSDTHPSIQKRLARLSSRSRREGQKNLHQTAAHVQ